MYFLMTTDEVFIYCCYHEQFGFGDIISGGIPTFQLPYIGNMQFTSFGLILSTTDYIFNQWKVKHSLSRFHNGSVVEQQDDTISHGSYDKFNNSAVVMGGH